MSNELKFNIKYRVPVRILYDALTNPTELTKFTQCVAKFENSVGGTFNLYDGFITGINEVLEENKKIVQKWKFSSWKDYGELALTFKEKPGSECMVVVYLKDIPDKDNTGQIVDLPVLEKGFRSQIFEKISTWLGYPLNNDQSDSDDD